MKVITVFLIIIFSFKNLDFYEIKPNEIYEGKKGLWYAYYDSSKTKIIIEIGGIKYGNYDYLEKRDISDDNIIACSSSAILYKKKGKLYYSNSELNIELRLKKKEYDSKIDYKRNKIFETYAFTVINKLKREHDFEDYHFKYYKEDYLFYRDSDSSLQNYKPKYLQSFFEELSEK